MKAPRRPASTGTGSAVKPAKGTAPGLKGSIPLTVTESVPATSSVHGSSHSHVPGQSCCQHEHVAEMPELAARLRSQSRRVTGPRQAILEVMRCNPRPMTIKEIHSLLSDRGCDLATVYRSMSMLQEARMVCRVNFEDSTARFELLGEGDDGHHHHLVCTRCDRVLEIEECVVEEIQKKLATRSGFKGITHRLEFFGVCPSCQ